jgi:hypothetical protein
MELKIEDYMGLVHSMARSFHLTTGLPYEELLSSAYLAFMEAKESYDPEEAVFSTHLWIVCRRVMCDFCQSSQRWSWRNVGAEDVWLESIEDGITPESLLEFKENLDFLSDEAKFICKMILEDPQQFITHRPKLSRGIIKDKLRDLGWAWSKIWTSMGEIKATLSQTV